MSKILVIEDDPIYREMVVEALSEEGHELLTAENGEDGIGRARAYVPDLVISDVVMEKADGYQILATLRNEPSTAGIPFIMMTGWSSKGGQRQGMALGADDYLSKPFNATELIDAVTAQLKKKERTQSQIAKQTTVSETSVSALLPAEVGNPLQTIIGMGQILSRPQGGLSPSEIITAGQQITASAFRIQKAVDNFVLYNQLLGLESDQNALAELRTAHTSNIKEILDTRALNLARSRGREADLTLKTTDGSIDINQVYLERIMDELLDNALKFSAPGDAIELICAFSPDRVGLAVTDHGRGMTNEQIQNVNAFVQFGKMTENKAGLGLGLAIARKISLLHGGALSIKSKLGERTRVTVELKCA